VRRSIAFRPGFAEELARCSIEDDRTVNWLVNEAVAVFLRARRDAALAALDAVTTQVVIEPSSACRHGLSSCGVCGTAVAAE